MVGSQIGHYLILAELGRGGMGSVYRARDLALGREVALKVLSPALLENPEFRARFAREAQIAAKLDHPAIVPVFEYGEERGLPFIAMRLMPGGTLADRIQHGQLSMYDIVRVMRRICAALDKAHALGVVHRDLKPGNILFDEDGDSYLADFGIARLTEGTQTRSMLATPQYVAPEQARGLRLDARTDVYQMGVVLFEMLTGRLPFSNPRTEGQVQQHLHEQPPAVRSFNRKLPRGCDGVIFTALAKQPEQRYSSAGALAHAFAAAVGFGPPTPVSQPFVRGGSSAKPGTIAAHTQTLTSFLLQRMSTPQLLLLASGLVLGLAVATFFAASYLRLNLPWLWSFFNAFFFLAGAVAFAVSNRPIAPLLVHIPTHFLVLAIVWRVELDTQLALIFAAAAVASGLSLYLVLLIPRVPLLLRYILGIGLSYLAGIAILVLFSPLSNSLIGIPGALVIGLLAYLLDEVFQGVRAARRQLRPI